MHRRGLSSPAWLNSRQPKKARGRRIACADWIMAFPIEDYAIIGDCHTAALVARDGSIDWMCLPRFDSGACFASLIGTPENGYWRVHPSHKVKRVTRRYRGESLILETEFETESGAVRLTDFMPLRDGSPEVIRVVRGLRGRVAMRMDLKIRF